MKIIAKLNIAFYEQIYHFSNDANALCAYIMSFEFIGAYNTVT